MRMQQLRKSMHGLSVLVSYLLHNRLCLSHLCLLHALQLLRLSVLHPCQRLLEALAQLLGLTVHPLRHAMEELLGTALLVLAPFHSSCTTSVLDVDLVVGSASRRIEVP